MILHTDCRSALPRRTRWIVHVSIGEYARASGNLGCGVDCPHRNQPLFFECDTSDSPLRASHSKPLWRVTASKQAALGCVYDLGG